MSADRDPELEALLRSALSAEADEVEPAWDGLTRIRARVSARSSWLNRWAMPALALAGAAAVIAAITVLPQVLPDGRGGGTTPAAGSATTGAVSGSASVTSPPAAATATGSPGPAGASTPRASGTAPVPGSTTPSTSPSEAVSDLATVWPYSSRLQGTKNADADIASGKYPHLRDAAATAVDFVGSFVGRDGLTAQRLDAYPPGVRMRVNRGDIPVSTVFLVRVRAGDDGPYVVVSASRDTLDPAERLTLAAPPAVRSTDAVAVGGQVRRDAGEAAPTVIVELREPGQDEPLAQTTVPVTSADGSWSTVLTPLRAPATTAVVAAWTADADGGVLEFVAAPTAG